MQNEIITEKRRAVHEKKIGTIFTRAFLLGRNYDYYTKILTLNLFICHFEYFDPNDSFKQKNDKMYVQRIMFQPTRHI